MNLGAARVVLRVRTAADVLDLAAPFCLRNRAITLPLCGLVLAPAFGLCLLARHQLGARWGLVWLLAIALGALCQAPFTVAYSELMFVDPSAVRCGAVLRRTARRLPSFAFARLLTTLVHAFSLCLVVLIGYTGSIFLVVPEASLLEGAGPFAAIARSARAVRGRALAAFGVALALVLLPAVGVLAGELVGGTIVSMVLQLGEPFGSLFKGSGGTPFALAGFFATVPLVAAARFLTYIDLRTRKEGWDIQLRFLDIARAEAPSAEERAG
ncbi:MAG TPA: hypothetical protein VGP07_00765 [Polyangia bacterium]|jgi:hypothetical protein